MSVRMGRYVEGSAIGGAGADAHETLSARQGGRTLLGARSAAPLPRLDVGSGSFARVVLQQPAQSPLASDLGKTDRFS